MRSVCVFCGSQPGFQDEYTEATRQLARMLAEQSIDIVYGGASVGLMGVLADECLQQNGRVIGVIPQRLCHKEVLHPHLSETYITDDLTTRKVRMMELADAFIALPGGIGTYDEIFEVLSLAQLGLHGKPMGLVNTRGYFDPLLHLLQQSVHEGFVRPQYFSLLLHAPEPDLLMPQLQRRACAAEP